MRKILLPTLSVSLLTLASTISLAADLPSRRAPPVFVPPPPIPVFTWTGFYVGANAGAAFNTQGQGNSYYFPAGSIAGSSGTSGTLTTGNRGGDNAGFTGGGQIGYNYQLGGAGLGGLAGGLIGPSSGIVLGVVADAQYLDKRRLNGGNGQDYTFTGGQPGNAFVQVAGLPRTNVITTQGGRTDFFGTVRGRLGVGFDRVLIYGTGGFAYNTKATGYTVGGGLEYAITNNISVGAEYLYVNLNRSFSSNATYVPSPGLGAGTLYVNSRGGRDNFSVARAAINYKFDMFAPMAPVVARY